MKKLSSDVKKRYSYNVKSKKFCFGIIISLYIMFSLAGTISGLLNKVSAETKDSVFYVESIKVREGDTLWSIAESYHSDYYNTTAEYVRAIKASNNLVDDKIVEGTNLVIPYTK